MDIGMAVVDRYRDGYRVAKWLGTAGLIMKVAAWIVGAAFAYVALAGSQNQGPALFGGVQYMFEALRLSLGLFAAAVSWFFFFVTGVIFSAISQVLRATLDTAVNTSPFMGEEAKSIAMSLPVTITSQT